MSVLEKYEQQYADETGKVEPQRIIPMGDYIGVPELFSAEEEPEDTQWGVPGRLVVTWHLHLTNDEGKQETVKFLKTTPSDYRKNWETGQWLAAGDPGHSDKRPNNTTKFWRMLSSFDKKNKLSIPDTVKGIQEHTYKVKVGTVYMKDGEKDGYAYKQDDTVRYEQEGYAKKQHFIVGMYPQKDTAV